MHTHSERAARAARELLTTCARQLAHNRPEWQLNPTRWNEWQARITDRHPAIGTAMNTHLASITITPGMTRGALATHITRALYPEGGTR